MRSSRPLVCSLALGALLLLGVGCSTTSATNGPVGSDGGDASSTSDAANVTAACTAERGTCVLGGHPCVHVGTSDCNPTRNPGGAFCCLDTAAADTTCSTPLGDAGFSTLDNLPLAELCAQSDRGLIRWTSLCAGSIVVLRGEGVDCDSVWLFDATTKQLEATGHGCNVGAVCTGGIPGFVFPSECFTGDFSTDVVPLCPSAGDAGHDASADAAGE